MKSLFVLLLAVLVFAGCGATPGPAGPAGDEGGNGDGDGTGTDSAPGPALHDVIAYVAPGGDEIRTVTPDGSEGALIWSHGTADPNGYYSIWDLDWSPSAREIAFTGNHEMECSLLRSDVYAVGTNGLEYRRLSGPPSCAGLSEYPSAVVNVPVVNETMSSLDVYLYYSGASAAEQVSLPPGGSTVVTFESVADLGEGVDQFAFVIKADRSELLAVTTLDVTVGSTHTTPQASIFEPFSNGWEASSPSWNFDGTEVGFAFNLNEMYGQDPKPAEALSLGDPLLESGDTMPNIVSHLNWNPAAEFSEELLYVGWDFDTITIYLARQGEPGPGQVVATLDSFETVLGMAWIPDGSGFVFSFKEGAFGDRADVWSYSLETGEAVRVTNLSGEFAGQLSVSPDGQRIVFERATELTTAGNDLVEPDLWVVNIDGSGLAKLVEGGSDPDWSSAAP